MSHDPDGYPTDDELKQIQEWDTSDLPGLFRYIQDLWNWGQDYCSEGPKGTWTLITGGWSGNESLVGALSQNLLAWSLCWESSHRGGKHIFEIPERFMVGKS